jgi:uncharacterized membrane protein
VPTERRGKEGPVSVRGAGVVPRQRGQEGNRVAEPRIVQRATAVCLVAVCLLTVVLVGANLHIPLRLPLVLLTVGVVPGWALISYLNLRQVSLLWISAVGISLAISLLGALVMVLFKAWYPRAAVSMLALMCLVPLTRHVWRTRR